MESIQIQQHLTIKGDQERKLYFYNLVSYSMMGLGYLFAISNYFYGSPLAVILHNLTFGILFTLCYTLRETNFELVLFITGILFQVYIFRHA